MMQFEEKNCDLRLSLDIAYILAVTIQCTTYNTNSITTNSYLYYWFEHAFIYDMHKLPIYTLASYYVYWNPQ